MRLMTFNLRFANPLDGPHHWDFRKEMVVETILTYAPDLLGTQEGTVPQLEYLAEHLPGYAPLIAHRQTDRTCQYPTIFYRLSRFEVRDSDEFWLSETPRQHRSLSWNSAFPRMVTFGLFRERHRSLWFYFLNTHLDHISAQARWHGARIIREQFLGRLTPVILVGDFNEAPEAPVYRLLLAPDTELLDTWRAFHPPGDDPTTQHDFTGQGRGSRIDWILVSPPFQTKKVEIIAYNRAGRYPSDHFPYLAEVDY